MHLLINGTRFGNNFRHLFILVRQENGVLLVAKLLIQVQDANDEHHYYGGDVPHQLKVVLGCEHLFEELFSALLHYSDNLQKEEIKSQYACSALPYDVRNLFCLMVVR